VANLTKIAKIRVSRGTEANLPFGYEIGRLYLTTDTHKLFAGQGLNLPLVEVAGGGGGQPVVTLLCGENVNAYQAVAVRSDGLAYKADAGTVADASRFVGVAITSATAGNSIQVQQEGVLVNNGFLFTAGEAVFLGAAGALVQTPNAGAFELPLGVALSSSELAVQIGLPIVFA